MNHRLTIAESTFTAENIPDGQQILDKENDLNKQKTCVDADTIVFVSMVTTELVSALIALFIMVSVISESSTSHVNGRRIIALVVVQVVVATVAHSLALIAICRSFGRVLLVACTLNFIEVLLNISRVCWAGNSGEVSENLTEILTNSCF